MYTYKMNWNLKIHVYGIFVGSIMSSTCFHIAWLGFLIIGTLGKEIISTRMIYQIVKYPSRLCNLVSVFCNLSPSFEFLHRSLFALQVMGNSEKLFILWYVE